MDDVTGSTPAQLISTLAAAAETGDTPLPARTISAVRRLSRINPDWWTPAIHQAVSKALTLAGITHDSPPASAGDALADTRALWRRTANPQVRAAHVDGHWHLKTPAGHPALVHALATPDARRSWLPDATVIPDPAWAAEVFLSHVVYVKDEYDDRLDEILALSPPDHVTVADDALHLLVTPSTDHTDALKTAGARWDGKALRWTVPLDKPRVVAAVGDLIDVHGWRCVPDARQAIRERSDAWAQSLAASVALDAPDLVVPGLNPSIRLRPFQRAGIAYMAAKRRAFNADSPGLGKTLQALSTFAVTGSLPAIVVTKAKLKTNWAQREIPKAFPGWTTTIVEGRKAAPIEPADVIIVNYDILQGRLDDLTALNAKAIAFDESHQIKTATSARTKAGVDLARTIAEDGGVVLCLTATPMPNRQYELWPQIRALAHDDLFGSSKGYATKFCGAKTYRVKGKPQLRVHEEPVPPERDLELNELLRSTCMVVRHKNDVLTDLPPLELLPVAVDPDPKAAKEYQRAKADIESYAVARAREIAREEGRPPGQAEWRARLAVESNKDLVELGNLRRLADTAKVPGVLDFTTGLITDNPIDPDTDKPMKILLFAHYRDVQAIYAEQTEERLRKELNKAGIDLGLRDDMPAVEWLRSAADQKTAEADAIVDRFQSDPTLRILVCSASAIAEGVTLTAAGHVVLAHTPWHWSQVEQQAGRCIAAGTLVSTARGELPIENIKTGDRVLTHLGRFRPVTDTMARPVDDPLLRITTARSARPLECTPDHLLWVKDSVTGKVEWREARTVGFGDCLASPRTRTATADVVSLVVEPGDQTFRPGRTCLDCESDALVARQLCDVHYRRRKKAGTLPDVYEMPGQSTSHVLPDSVQVTPELAWAIGRWLGDGWVKGHQGRPAAIGICGSSSEGEAVLRASSTIASAFGLPEPSLKIRGKNTVDAMVFSAALTAVFDRTFLANERDGFAKGSQGAVKRIPEVLMTAPEPIRWALFCGYLSADGTTTDRRWRWVTVSPHLARQVARLAASCGYEPSLRQFRTRNRDAWEGHISLHSSPREFDLRQSDDLHVWNPVRRVDTISGTVVHDLTVDEDHSFIAADVAVHNCYGRLNDAHGIGLWAPYVPDTIDEAVINIIERKRETSERVVLGKLSGIDDSEAAVAAELFASLGADPSAAARDHNTPANNKRSGATGSLIDETGGHASGDGPSDISITA